MKLTHANKINDLNGVEINFQLEHNDDSGNQILEDLEKIDSNGFNFDMYQSEVRARGNQPYLLKDILKIENSQAKTCKSCLFFRGEFGTKYLCNKKVSFEKYLNDCFVSKKELDDLDFCIDYKYDYNKSKKSMKTFHFNQPFKDIWE